MPCVLYTLLFLFNDMKQFTRGLTCLYFEKRFKACSSRPVEKYNMLI